MDDQINLYLFIFLFLNRISPKVDTIPVITLSKGPSTALQPVTEVAKNVSAKDGQYKWTIPANIPAGDDCKFYKYI